MTEDISTTPTAEPSESTAFPVVFIYGMVVSGFLGSFIIPLLGGHVWRNLREAPNHTRALYVVFFSSFWTLCMAYAFFRLDIILPMGTTIPCKFGYYLTTQSVYVAKLILVLVFMLRVDIAFHNSALGYNRKCLSVLYITMVIILTAVNVAFIIVTWDMVTFETATYFDGFVTVGICTSGSGQGKYSGLYSIVLGMMFLLDVTYNGIVCAMFVYKLRVVVQMDTGSSNGGGDKKLKKVMKKQTSLVIFAALTTLFTLGCGVFLRGFSLMIPLDATVNSMCVWLMFSFSDNVWNKLIRSCCCCCHCCDEEDFLMTLRSLRQSLRQSLRSDSKTRKKPNNVAHKNNSHSNSSPRTRENTVPSASNGHHDDIINFENAKNITSLANTKDEKYTIELHTEDPSHNMNHDTYIPHTNSGDNMHMEMGHSVADSTRL